MRLTVTIACSRSGLSGELARGSETRLMTVICAWCGRMLGSKPGEGTSHGICAECMRSISGAHDAP